MAGLFEGEGWIGWKKPGTDGGPHLEMRLGMTDEDTVQRFFELAGIGKMYGPYRRFAPDGVTMASIGRKYNVPTSSIRKIRDGDTYKYVT
jgi:hypothetical protein